MNQNNNNLVEAIRNNDSTQVERWLAEGADPNLYIYGYIIENIRSPSINNIMVKYGAITDVDHFSTCRNIMMVQAMIQNDSTTFWHKAYHKFFPDNFKPSSTIGKPVEGTLYKDKFYNNCIQINSLNLEEIDIDMLKKVYRNRYPLKFFDPYIESLIKWDICKDTEFSIETMRTLIKDKKKSYFYRFDQIITKKDSNNIKYLTKVVGEFRDLIEIYINYDSHLDMPLLTDYTNHLEYFIDNIDSDDE